MTVLQTGQALSPSSDGGPTGAALLQPYLDMIGWTGGLAELACLVIGVIGLAASYLAFVRQASTAPRGGRFTGVISRVAEKGAGESIAEITFKDTLGRSLRFQHGGSFARKHEGRKIDVVIRNGRPAAGSMRRSATSHTIQFFIAGVTFALTIAYGLGAFDPAAMLNMIRVQLH